MIMKKEEFIEELIDILELEDNDVNFATEIALDSLSILSIISFLDENFSKKATGEQLESVKSINDIVQLVGECNIK